MLIDLIVVVLLLLAVFKGLRTGFIVALFSLAGFIIGMAVAVKVSAVAAASIGTAVNISQRWLPLVAFVLVFVGVVLLVRLGARAVQGLVEVALLGWANKLAGVLFFALLYIFVFSIILFYVGQTGFVKPETIAASQTYPYIQPLGPKVINGLSTIIPFFNGMFHDLNTYFSPVFDKQP